MVAGDDAMRARWAMRDGRIVHIGVRRELACTDAAPHARRSVKGSHVWRGVNSVKASAATMEAAGAEAAATAMEATTTSMESARRAAVESAATTVEATASAVTATAAAAAGQRVSAIGR